MILVRGVRVYGLRTRGLHSCCGCIRTEGTSSEKPTRMWRVEEVLGCWSERDVEEGIKASDGKEREVEDERPVEREAEDIWDSLSFYECV